MKSIFTLVLAGLAAGSLTASGPGSSSSSGRQVLPPHPERDGASGRRSADEVSGHRAYTHFERQADCAFRRLHFRRRAGHRTVQRYRRSQRSGVHSRFGDHGPVHHHHRTAGHRLPHHDDGAAHSARCRPRNLHAFHSRFLLQLGAWTFGRRQLPAHQPRHRNGQRLCLHPQRGPRRRTVARGGRWSGFAAWVFSRRPRCS